MISILFALGLVVFSVFIILSYVYDWEFVKKESQKGKPYHKYDKIIGISFGITLILFAIFIFVKSF